MSGPIWTPLIISALIVLGTWLITVGRHRRLSLNQFYEMARPREFDDVRILIESPQGIIELVSRWMSRRMTILRKVGALRRMHERVAILLEVAGTGQAASAWLTNTALLVIASIAVTMAIVAVTGIPVLVATPAVVAILQWRRLVSEARKRRERIRRLLPPILALMSSAGDVITGLDGSGGLISWAINTIDDDVTAIFHDMLLRSIAQNRPIEDVFEERATRWDLIEFGMLANLFRLAHQTGNGLQQGLRSYALAWQEEQSRVLEAGAAKKVFFSTIPLIICDVPALMILLLAPAGFQIAAMLHL